MAAKKKANSGNGKKVTRYTYNDVKEPRSPETGHTSLLPADELTVSLGMDNGWSKKLQVTHIPEDEKRPVVVDMDPDQDPVLFWAGKRNRREIPVLPLQRNEIVSESRIAQIIDRAKQAAAEKNGSARQASLFADLERTLRESEKAQRVEFYTHEEGWKNKLICGDSLQVMESLLHYEGLRGKVQMIYMDPPYAVRYDSNFQQRVTSIRNDDNDRADDIVTIKAFRDTWTLGVHSYLSHLQERLYLVRELLTDSGSVFVQISDENVHRVRCLMDEVFGAANFIALIPFRKKTMPFGTTFIEQMADFLLWYGKAKFTQQGSASAKFYPFFLAQDVEGEFHHSWFELPDRTRHKMTPEQLKNHALLPDGARVYRLKSLEPSGPMESGRFTYTFEGKQSPPPKNGYGTTPEGMDRLRDLGRLQPEGTRLTFVMYADESVYTRLTAPWTDTVGADEKRYVVQTNTEIVKRCLLMTTDPGDLVLDPTCGAGTTAAVAEAWGRRWVTCDTSRVAINVARQHLLSKVFPMLKTRSGTPSSGFFYESVKKTTLGNLANDLEASEIELRDQPVTDPKAVRVCGPLEVMTIGRYSIEDWKGYVAEGGKLANYIEVICRLYRKDAAIQGASGLVHAIAESDHQKIAISVGPLAGRVTGKQINDGVQDALASGVLEVHVLGWAFEANVCEIKSQL
ncbi:MAG: site-specific DNA-methyltransferase, partial [Polyangiaceae bacterium]